jgi:hypothetical protein
VLTVYGYNVTTFSAFHGLPSAISVVIYLTNVEVSPLTDQVVKQRKQLGLYPGSVSIPSLRINGVGAS